MRLRLVLAIVLGIVALSLYVVDEIVNSSREPARISSRIVAIPEETIPAILDSLYMKYGIDLKQVRTWKVESASGSFTRTEQRIYVPPKFMSVQFNLELNRALEGTGARAVGTERSREQTVSIHIKKDERVIRSLQFVPDPKLREKK